MRSRYHSILLVVVLTSLLLGCAGSGSPVEPTSSQIPDLTESRDAACTGHERLLFGFWDVAFNMETAELDVVPLRQSDFHLNVVRWLNTPASIEVTIVDANVSEGEFTLDVTLNHPLPESKFRGFDVHGTVFGDGPDLFGSKNDPDIMWIGPGGFRMDNADGWTRWWNPSEFTTPGLFGYNPGLFGTSSTGQATLNPYKYFASALTPTSPVVPSVNSSNRGTFDTDGGAVTRRYELTFPVVGDKPVVRFQYALDANWAPPTGGGPVPSIENFPPDANCPEAFHIRIVSNRSGVFYFDQDKYGGELDLDIEVFDWGAHDNPAGIDGEIGALRIESPTLFNPVIEIPIDSEPGSSDLSGVYTITVPYTTPTGTEDQYVLISVVAAGPISYAPPVGVSEYPEDANLAAYLLYNVPVESLAPDKKGQIPTPGQAIDVETTDYFSYVLDSTSELQVYFVFDPLTCINLGTVPLPGIPKELDVEGGYAYIIDENNTFNVVDVEPVINAQVVHTIDMGEVLHAVDVDGSYCYVGGETGNLSIIDISIPESAFVVNSIPVSLGSPINDIEVDGTFAYVAAEGLSILQLDLHGNASTIKVVPTESEARVVALSGNGLAFVGNSSSSLLTVNALLPSDAYVADTYALPDVANDIDYFEELINVTVAHQGLMVTKFDPIEAEMEFLGEEDDLNNPGDLSVDNSLAYIIDEGDVQIVELWENPESIKLLKPNGGEILPVAGDTEIHWGGYGFPGNVSIDYSKDDFFLDFQSIATDTENDGSFNWENIPLDPSETVKVRITSTSVPTIYDDSDDYFTIATPTIEVQNPNGGELLPAGTTADITWTSDGYAGTVVLEYSKDDFVSDINPVATDQPSSGTYEWDVPIDISDTIKIRVSSTLYPEIFDASDDYFSIVEWIEVLYPNGGETFDAGTDEDIAWEHQYSFGSVKIEYSKDNFVSDINLISADEPNDGVYTWSNIPADPSETVRIRIGLTGDPAISDISDADFTIEAVGWACTWGGLDDDVGADVAVDSDGFILVTGFFQWEVDFDPDPVETDIHTSQGGLDAYLCKFRPDGTLLWAVTWGGTGSDWGTGVIVGTSEEEIYVTGRFKGEVDFDPDPGGEDIHTSQGDFDAYLTKFLPTGIHSWAVTWGGTEKDVGYGIATDDDENIFVAGSFKDVVDFDPDLVDSSTETSAGELDGFLSKFNDAGEFIWVNVWGGALTDTGVSVATESGYSYVAGNYTDSASDAFLRKVDSGGSSLWTHIWGEGDNEYCNGVDVLAGVGVLVTGIFESTWVDFDPGPGVDIHFTNGGYDAFLSRFSTDGAHSWVQTWGGPLEDIAEGVVLDADQNIWVSGGFRDEVDFDPDPVNEETRTSVGDRDSYLVGYDGEVFQWVTTWGSTGEDFGSSVAIGNIENILVSGYFRYTVDFDPTISVDEHTSSGGSDAFLCLFEPDGTW